MYNDLINFLFKNMMAIVFFSYIIYISTTCMPGLFAYWVILRSFLSSADFFSKSTFLKKISGIPSVSNNLDPDQGGHFVGPDLGPNCLQWLSADDISRQRYNYCVLNEGQTFLSAKKLKV